MNEERPETTTGPSSPEDEAAAPGQAGRFGRRALLVGASAAIGGFWAKQYWNYEEGFQTAEVCVLRAADYDADLMRLLGEGLGELGLGRREVRGKSVLLKPNLVEPRRDAPHANTHPAVVRAAAEVFRSWDAGEVFVAEGQGHCRDAELVREQSGLQPVLDESQLPYVDLNHDEVYRAKNALGHTGMDHLYLPKSLKRADLIVSLAKMKTHHWAGVTLSMKNLFGLLPGVCYGWPKNVLHQKGITESILDVCATVRPHLAIVDGIVGMEGDGPIMGSPKPAGVLVMGASFPAVDATAARLMGFDPRRIPHLRTASRRLGPIRRHNIRQRGERIEPLVQRFELIDHPVMERFRG